MKTRALNDISHLGINYQERYTKMYVQKSVSFNSTTRDIQN